MDGVRAYWDGDKFLTRAGNIISCPEWFISTLPTSLTLDGELWMGKGTTHENVTKVLHTKNGDWSQMGYYVFDAPSFSGTYEERMKKMDVVQSLLSPHIHIVENIQCTGAHHLQKYLDTIVASKGEGVILRHPHSLHLPEFTTSLLKVKVQLTYLQATLIHLQKFEDAEVTVLQVLDTGLYCKQ